MKKVLTVLAILILGLTCFIAGCGDRYANLTISISTAQQRDSDGAITLYVDGDSEEITVRMSGAPADFNYVPLFAISNEIISIDSNYTVRNNGVKATITALYPGKTTLTAFTNEGSKKASLDINVIKKASSIAFKQSFSLALEKIAGATAQIDFEKHLIILPDDSNQRSVKYSLVDQSLSSAISITDKGLIVLNDDTITEPFFRVRAQVVDHLGNPESIAAAEANVYLINEIKDEDIDLYLLEKENDNIIAPGNKYSDITLIKNIDGLNTVQVILVINTKNNITLTYPSDTTKSVRVTPVNYSRIGDEYTYVLNISALQYDLNFNLRFQIELTGFEGQFDYHKDVKVICDSLIKDFSVNNVSLVSTEKHNLTVYKNDSTDGTRFRVDVSNPREISEVNGRFKLELYVGGVLVDNMELVNRYFSFTVVTGNTRINNFDIFNGTIANKSYIYVKANSSTANLQDFNFELKIVAEYPNNDFDYLFGGRPAEAFKAFATIKLNIALGVERLVDYDFAPAGSGASTINNAFGSSVNVDLTAVGTNDININFLPDSGDEGTISAYSNNENIVKVEVFYDKVNHKVTLRLIPVGRGTATIYVVCTTLNDFKTIGVNVYKPITDVFIDLQNANSNSNIGIYEQKASQNTPGRNTLKTVTAKINRLVYFDYLTNPMDAGYESIEFAVILNGHIYEPNENGIITDDDRMFILDTRNRSIIINNSTAVGRIYTVELTFTNYNKVQAIESFEVDCYVPIESIRIDLSSTQLYNPKKLGYRDTQKQNLVSTHAVVSVYPSNATYKFNINDALSGSSYIVRLNGVNTNDIFDRSGDFFKINENFGYFSGLDIVYIVAQINELGIFRTATASVVIRDPIVVDSIIAENVIDNEIVFKAGITPNFSPRFTVAPDNAFNKELLFEQMVFNKITGVWESATAATKLFDIKNATYSAIYDFEKGDWVLESDPTKVVNINGTPYEIVPVAGKAGSSRLIVVPLDKLKHNGTSEYYDWQGYLDIYVTIANGSSFDTAYHVKTVQDLKDIELALDKYYVQTADINYAGTFSAMGYATTTPLTGGLRGSYHPDPLKTPIKYSISNLSYATSGNSSLTELGLFYRNNGTIKELTLSYSYIQTTFVNNAVFGGVAATNAGLIEDITIRYANVTISANSNFTFGGVVGFNAVGGMVQNVDERLTGISGTANINITSGKTNFIGGVVGENLGILKGVGAFSIWKCDNCDYKTRAEEAPGVCPECDETLFEKDKIKVSFGDSGVTSSLNINITGSASLSIPTYTTAFGGGAGINNGTINGVITQGKISAVNCDGVGGLVGISTGGQVLNSYSSTTITGNNYVGGLAGVANNTVIENCSAENYQLTSNRARLFISGNNNVGGLIGYVTGNCTIDYCYVISYFITTSEGKDGKTAYETASYNNEYDVAGVSYVGGFIGYLASGSSLRSVASLVNIKATTSGSCFVGNNANYSNLNANFIIIRGTGFGSISQASVNSVEQIYSTFIINNTVNGGKTDDGKLITAGSVASCPNSIRFLTVATVNDGLPYLLAKDGLTPLFATLPITVSAKIQENADLTTYFKVQDNVAVLFYNEAADGVLTLRQMQDLNTVSLSSFAKVEVNPLTIRSARISITSDNPLVVSVNNDGTLQLLGEGSATITLSSKLNSRYNCTVYIVVKYGINGFELYSSSNRSPNDLLSGSQTIELVKNTSKNIYADYSYSREVDGKVKSLISSKDAGIRYIVYASDLNGISIYDAFRTVINWNYVFDGEYSYYYVDIDYGSSSIFTALGKTDNTIMVYAIPYVKVVYRTETGTITQESVLLHELETSFKMLVIDGATDIRFKTSVNNVKMTQLESYVITVVMDTDTNDDVINFVDAAGDNVSFSSIADDLNIVPTGEVTIMNGAEVIGKQKTYTITFKDKDTLIAYSRNYRIRFLSSLNSTVGITLNLTVLPQPIVSADINLYTSYEDYNVENGQAPAIYNGVPAAVELEVYPYFSYFDRLEVSYSTSSSHKLNITQIMYNNIADTFELYTNSGAAWINNALRVNKSSGADSLISGEDGTYSYSKLYYFSLLAETSIPDMTQFTVKVSFYRDNVLIAPFNATYTFVTIAQPKIDISLANEKLQGTTPVGTTSEIKVTTTNYRGSITWDVFASDGGDALKAETRQQLMPKLVNGKYYFAVPEDATLLGRTIQIRASIMKEDKKIIYNEIALNVLITKFTVTGIRINRASSASTPVLILPIFRTELMDLSIETVYSASYAQQPGVNTVEEIEKLRKQISGADVWWYENSLSLAYEQIDTKNDAHVGKKYNSLFEVRVNERDVPNGYPDGTKHVYGYEVDKGTGMEVNVHFAFDSNGNPKFSTGEETSTLYSLSSRFILIFNYASSLKNAIPVYDADDFYNMMEGYDYILINDIWLPNHTPLSTAITSLNGNNRTIFITGFSFEREQTEDVRLGLFDTVAAGTMIYNLNVHYASGLDSKNGTEEGLEEKHYDKSTGKSSNTETESTFTILEGRAMTNPPLELVYTNATVQHFGGIACVNNGIITNAQVSGKISISVNIDGGIVTSDVLNAGLVAENNAYITNSRVYNFDITAHGNIGGVVGINSFVMSAVYGEDIKIVNRSLNGTNINTGGFVYRNTANGIINECYIQGRRATSDTNIRNTRDGIQSARFIGGFVYDNYGFIENSYSNIAIDTNEYAAGFVYFNYNGATINNCYSTSWIDRTRNNNSPFTGLVKDGGIVVGFQGTISNSFFLNGDYATFLNEPAVGLALEDFAVPTKFVSYNIFQNERAFDKNNVPVEAEGYTWVIAEGRPQLINTMTKTISEQYYAGRKNFSEETLSFNRTVTKNGNEFTDVHTARFDDSGAGMLYITYGLKEVLDTSVGLIKIIVDIKTATINGKDLHLDADISGNYDISGTAEERTNGTIIITFYYRLSIDEQFFYDDRPFNVITGLSESVITYAEGTRKNPYVIYDHNSYNYYFSMYGESLTSEENTTREYYRFVSDISFNFTTPITSGLTLRNATIEGNNMTIRDITLIYTDDQADIYSFGLFAKFDNVKAFNLNIRIVEIQSAVHRFVGGLVGWATGDTYIKSVNIIGENDEGIVLGRNIAGGLIGLATGNTVIEDIDITINVNAVFAPIAISNKINIYNLVTVDGSVKFYDEKTEENTADKTGLISYAGAAVGILDSKSASSTHYNAKNINVSGRTKVVGQMVGGVFGLVGNQTRVREINFTLSNSTEYVRGFYFAGGLIGENRGYIENSTIAHVERTQQNIDTGAPGSIASGANSSFFNAVTSTVAIGGLVGFNNGGDIYNSLSKVDVRNTGSKVAGGAVGRMLGGTLESVVSTGSVRANDVMGGLVGVINDKNQLTDISGLFIDVYAYLQADPDRYDEVTQFKTSAVIINNCVAATNWLVADYQFLRPRYNYTRVASGLIGLINTGKDNLNIENLIITNNSYVNSAYGSTNPNSGTTSYHTLYPAYFSGTLDNAILDINAGEEIADATRFPFVNKTLLEQVFDFGETAKTFGRNNNSVGKQNIGFTHFQVYNGYKTSYVFTITKLATPQVITIEGTSITIYGTATKTYSYSKDDEASRQSADARSRNERIIFKTILFDIFTGTNRIESIGTRTEGTLQYSFELGFSNLPEIITPENSTADKNLKEYIYSGYNNNDSWDKDSSFYTGGQRHPNVVKNAHIFNWIDYAAESIAGAGTYESPYLITTAEELAFVAKKVNKYYASGDKDGWNADKTVYTAADDIHRDSNRNKYVGTDVYYKISNNIDLSGKYWTPIGTKANPFVGNIIGNKINGKNPEILYATVNAGGNKSASNQPFAYAGLFGYVEGDGIEIRDLEMIGGTVDGAVAGGIVGYAAGTLKIINCLNRTDVKGSIAVGGLLGYSPKAEIDNCKNYGIITLNNSAVKTRFTYLLNNVGAPFVNESIVEGNSTGTINCYAGGIAGRAATIKKSNNYAEFVVGDVFTDYNKTISGTSTSKNRTRSNIYAGGVVGYVTTLTGGEENGNSSGNYGSCVLLCSAHNVTFGGVAGYAKTITRVENRGTISVVYQNSRTISNERGTSYYQKDVVPFARIGGVVGEIEEEGQFLSNFKEISFVNSYSNYSIIFIGGVAGTLQDGANLYESFNIDDISTSAIDRTTILSIGGLAGGMLSLNETTELGEIKDCYNNGLLRANNRARTFVGGVFGSVIYVDDYKIIEEEVEYYIPSYCLGVGEVGVGEGRFIGISGKYSSTEINFINPDHKINIENTYNTGAVITENAVLGVNFTGGIVGYNSHIKFNNGLNWKVDIKNNTNFYLVDVAKSAGTYLEKVSNDDTFPEADATYSVDSVSGETVKTGNLWQKLSNDLKSVFSNNPLTPEDEFANFNKVVDTWYPTLKNNPADVYWDEYTTSFQALSKNNYEISSAEQLAYLSYAVNEGLINTLGLTFTLTANIDMTGKYFTPIGIVDETNNINRPFRGTFNGDGFTIQSLTVDGAKLRNKYENGPYGDYGALFGYISGAIITNLAIKSPIIQNVAYGSALVVYSMGREVKSGSTVTDVISSKISYVYTEQYVFTETINDTTVEFRWGGIHANAPIKFYEGGSHVPEKDKAVAAGLVCFAKATDIEKCYNNIPLYVGEDNHSTTDAAGVVAGGIVGIAENSSPYGLDNTIKNTVIKDSYNNAMGNIYFNFARNITSANYNHRIAILGVKNDCAIINHTFNLAFIYNYQTTDYVAIDGSRRIVIEDSGWVVTYDGPTIEYATINGWDMVDTWTTEYTLNLSPHDDTPSIRGLGENWINTESNKLILCNSEKQQITSGTGNLADYINYYIRTPEELAWVARGVNNGTLKTEANIGGTLVQYNFILDNNLIDGNGLEGKFWTPIGTLQYPFKGIFNFNGHTLSGMVIDATSLTYVGLFGYTNGAIIKDGVIENSYVKLNNKENIRAIYAGTVIGGGYNTSLLRTHITSNVYALGQNTVLVGGAAGMLTGNSDSKMRIEDVHFNEAPYVIKLEGENNPNSTSKYYNSPDNILGNSAEVDTVDEKTHFYDEGDPNIGFGVAAVSFTENAYAGGIIGQYSGSVPMGRPQWATLRFCENNANILSYSKTKGLVYAGGIVAYLNELVRVDNVQNDGNIKTFVVGGRDYVGGIIGVCLNSHVKNAYNAFLAEGSDGRAGYIEPSMNSAEISYVGGIIGYMNGSTTLGNTINTGGISGSLSINKLLSGGIFGYADPLYDGEVARPANLKGEDGNSGTHLYLTDFTNNSRGYGYYGGNENSYEYQNNIYSVDLDQIKEFGSGIIYQYMSQPPVSLSPDNFGTSASYWSFGTVGATMLPKLTTSISVLRVSSGISVYVLVGGEYKLQQPVNGEISITPGSTVIVTTNALAENIIFECSNMNVTTSVRAVNISGVVDGIISSVNVTTDITPTKPVNGYRFIFPSASIIEIDLIFSP